MDVCVSLFSLAYDILIAHTIHPLWVERLLCSTAKQSAPYSMGQMVDVAESQGLLPVRIRANCAGPELAGKHLQGTAHT